MVYITPSLFGHDPAYNSFNFPTPTHPHIHNVMADSHVTAGLGKRKRRADDVTEGPNPKHISISSTETDRSGSDSRMSLSRSSPTSEGFIRSSTSSNLERRPVKQMKRSNPRLVKAPSHLMDIEVDMPSSPPVQKAVTQPSSDLRSCHACGSAPKRKRDLENYLDCRRCEERTCYICARKCSGCQREICKECIVEIGKEGDPWCLECYQHINL
ncbi:hypothetical protein BU23DRAFT_539982 [Bimuria novae-zelandiae CBS 107.79]|uniref:Uncharacterized protein n=1 Tax=Bimuria novae-zelandiae CBS 107.79 TaxID=1447943 RepID=A0A6A5UWL9_9PLEO|nr:hypothetical protein BU23DRAFT_539982 [Bimuria novae-zelandiae CBS 107.79]